MIKKNTSSLMRRQARQGYLFIIPLVIGLIWFFIIPIVRSLIFSFCSVTLNDSGTGYDLAFQGIKSYIYAFREDADYVPGLLKSIGQMCGQAPLIIIFSFFMASILNQEFKGRTFFRVIMFLPIVVVSATLTEVNSGDSLQYQMGAFNSFKGSFSSGMTSFSSEFFGYMQDVGISADITEKIQGLIDGVYDIIDLSAIQILILLTGMQSISPSLYEAAKVEGGTAWENFWKITFPMVSPLILTCVIYTIIDSFTATGNTIMDMIDKQAFSNANFSVSAAMSWSYFAIVMLILGAVSFLLSKVLFYHDK